MFTAECDKLHLVTEADTFEALTERVWELAPDMIETNELGIDPHGTRLRKKASSFRRRPESVRLRRRTNSTVKVRVGVSQDSVAEGNCVIARWGGEQPEANWQSVIK